MKLLVKKIFIALFITVQACAVNAQSISEQMAATVMDMWKDSLVTTPGRPVKWSYDQGVILEGIDAIWKRTGDDKYFRYIQHSMDNYVDKDGNIRTYKQEDYNIDNIKNGRSILTLYKTTLQPKYFKAATHLWDQLQKQPRTKEGGFWHKKIYPNQMWLDGLYMGEPFYTEYAALTNNTKAFDDIANQFIWMEKHARDPKTGLLYHGWDESKAEKWANKVTGNSPNFWARAMGWYAMALVDVLDNFPRDHPKQKELTAILNRLTVAIQKVQDPKSGLWFDVLDKPAGKGNYHEASAANMFVYAVAKGVRMGYLPASYKPVANKGYEGIKKEFIEQRAAGMINLKGTVAVSGLGGNPYRDGSYEYYMKEPVITNDAKGIGAFLLAANEMELAAIPKSGAGKLVTLDNYFNNEYRKSVIDGSMEPFHYLWTERDLNGYSFFEQAFTYRGARTSTLAQAPTPERLRNSSVYIIVDPDTEKETAKPNFIQPEHVKAISDWVRAGGMLLLLGNDLGNAEFAHFNTLAEKFGIHFNEDSKNRVQGSQYETGAIKIPAGHPIFKNAKQVYIKELSTFKLNPPATASLANAGDVIIATAKYGKGTVLAIGDPWFYNEYTDGRKDYPDGRKLPKEYENYKAANDVAEWLLKQVPVKSK